MQNAVVVTASGEIHTKLLPVPRASHGPELQQLLYGSEGNLGMIVRVSHAAPLFASLGGSPCRQERTVVPVGSSTLARVAIAVST